MNFFLAVYLIGAFIFLPGNLKKVSEFIEHSAAVSSRYENAARWMYAHIPSGELIYHSYWDDSPYFMCLNPKNNYISCLDPIYTYYGYCREFDIINNLSMGRIGNPYQVLRKVFKANYGYLRKAEPLYRQIRREGGNFGILYEDTQGVVFRLNTQ